MFVIAPVLDGWKCNIREYLRMFHPHSLKVVRVQA
jgi:hypothetical protein